MRLARALADRDFTQQEVADHFGVTQAVVSQYVSGDAVVIDRIAIHPKTRETVNQIVDGFADGELNSYDALAEMLDLMREFEDRDPMWTSRPMLPRFRGAASWPGRWHLP
ncbi:transcriptional regulator [Natrinema gelatinilyticum]|uniref:transcriptional regulator n=1 Tax=Natrinema gelatinilyticum TaxID=2961571 RepID=UPI0020C39077|nr:hypothetical protein [Natrinema gelatinilyticum]